MLTVLLVQLRFSAKSAAARDGFSRCPIDSRHPRRNRWWCDAEVSQHSKKCAVHSVRYVPLKHDE